jgi:TP901 family phage tail tape measure protein
MASEDIVIRFIVEDKKFKAGVQNSTKKLTFFQKQIQSTNRALGSFIGNLGANFALRALDTFVKVASDAVNTLIDFESALVGVGKTTNLQGKQLEALGQEVQALSKELPTATTELLQLTQNAAQLGVRGSDSLIKFTETAAKLGFTTDLSANQASIGLAKLLNLTGESTTTVDKLGSVFVELGNNFATTEAAILTVSTEVARATTQFGLTSAEVAGISTALSALGIQSEVAGTSIGRSFRKIQSAISEGGQRFQVLQQIIGESGAEIEEQFGQRPIEVFQKFIDGLNRISVSGGDVNSALRNVGLANDRLLKVLPPLIARNDLLVDSLKSARNEYIENNALNEEASNVTSTLESDIAELGNAYDDFVQSVLKEATPILKEVVNGFKEFLDVITPGNSIRQTEQEIESLNTKLKELQERQKQGLEFTELEKGVGVIRTELAIENVLKKLDEAEKREFNLRLNLATNDIEKEILTTQEQLRQLLNNTAEGLNNVSEKVRQKLIEQKRAELQSLKETQKQITAVNESADEAELAREEQKANARNLLREQLLTKEQNFLLQREQLSVSEFERVKQLVDAEFQERQAAINAQLEVTKKGSKEEQLLLDEANRLKIQKTQRTNQLIVQSNRRQFEDAASIFNSLGQLAALGGEKAFKVVQGFQLASAITSGIAAVQGALSTPPFWPLNAPQVLAATAKAATNVAAIKSQRPSFQQGGIVPGNSFSGDNIVANVNSAEMVLNRRQQAQLFNMANGGASGAGRQEIVVHTTVELDGEAIGKSVSRQVADGLELGENL